MRRFAVLLAPLLLAACSSYTVLGARFVDGRLAFVAIDGAEVECIDALSVVDEASGEVMWEIGGWDSPCQAPLPLRYGRKVVTVTQAAKPLRPGRRYEISGSAGGGHSVSGWFVVMRRAAWQVEDVPPRLLPDITNDPTSAASDIANEVH